MDTYENHPINGGCSNGVKSILYIYRRGLDHFGDPMWWPGESAWEIAVGAILTQNTAWANVEKALLRMKNVGVFSPEEIIMAEEKVLANAIRPSGYYNQKAKKLKALASWVLKRFGGDLKRARMLGVNNLREELLGIWGVGQETADSIILYALDLPVFVVDRYTVRILSRFGLPLHTRYERAISEVKDLVEGWSKNTQFLNRLHALFVLIGKEFCRSRPSCARCPLKEKCFTAQRLSREGG